MPLIVLCSMRMSDRIFMRINPGIAMAAVSAQSSSGARKATNVSLDEALLAEANALNINVSQAAEAGLARAVAERRAELWLAQNKEALDGWNAYVEEHGLPLAQYRGV
jgi:antitoxin CcdA